MQVLELLQFHGRPLDFNMAEISFLQWIIHGLTGFVIIFQFYLFNQFTTFQIKVAEKYASKDDINQALQIINHKLDNIETILHKKQDKE